MKKAWFGILGFAILCAVLGVSCISLHEISSITYSLRVEEASSTTEGTLSLSLSPYEPGKRKISLTCVLGEEEFSTTLPTEEDEWFSALLPILLAKPALTAFFGPIAASQSIYASLFLLARGNLEKGLMWKEKDEEGREVIISIPDEEIRFGRRALWIHIETDSRETLRVLMEKENFVPFVVDILDIKENRRIYLEAKTITWEGTAKKKGYKEHTASLSNDTRTTLFLP